MSIDEIIRVWKNPTLRRLLSEDELAAMPAHPAGPSARELNEIELAQVAGGHYCGSGWIPSHTGECTCANGITVCNWSSCTHSTHSGC